MSKLLIIGCGGHGKVVADTAVTSGIWDDIFYADDQFPDVIPDPGLPVVSDIAGVEQLKEQFNDLVVAIGNNSKRLELVIKFKEIGFSVPALIHPTAYVAESAILGAGSVVFANSAIQPYATLGAACVVNTSCSVDHDCDIGDAVHLAPGTHLAGDVTIGSESFLGPGTTVVRGTTIGERVIVGAGSVVLEDVKSERLVVGTPAREVEDKKR